MMSKFKKYKGIHPGIVIDRELKKRTISQRKFALSIDEHPQTFNAVTKGKRSLTTSLALKIERKLEIEEGTLVILQAYYDIQKTKEKEDKASPDFSLLSKSLFWDTDIAKINWKDQFRAVIQRVHERGNEIEKGEIERFYGPEKVRKVLMDTNPTNRYVIHNFNK